MSDFQNLDLRSPQSRRAGGGPLRGILITLAVVAVLFVLLAVLGAVNGGGEQVAPAIEGEQSAPAATQSVGD